MNVLPAGNVLNGNIVETKSPDLMNLRYLLVILMLATNPAQADDADRLMRDFAWEKRPLLVFAPDGRHEAYRRQVELLDAVGSGLRERDMTVIEAIGDDRVTVDGRVRATSATSFYRRYAVGADRFRVILVGKDGTVKLDSGEVVGSDELFALIDAMPMRRREMSLNAEVPASD